jgi:hypothetical protein
MPSILFLEAELPQPFRISFQEADEVEDAPDLLEVHQ